MSESTPGWQADPTGRFEHRYWDGSQWTDDVANAGVASTDAYDATTQTTAPGDATSTWPVAPVPPVGGEPASTAPASKRGLFIGGGILAAVVIAVLLLGGGDDKADLSATNTTNTIDTTSSTDSNAGTILNDSGQLPPDFEKQMAASFETTMGLPAAKAECLAGKVADAIASGDRPRDEAMSNVLGYFAACHITMDEISGN